MLSAATIPVGHALTHEFKYNKYPLTHAVQLVDIMEQDWQLVEHGMHWDMLLRVDGRYDVGHCNMHELYVDDDELGSK